MFCYNPQQMSSTGKHELAFDYGSQDQVFDRAFAVLRRGIDDRAFPGAALAVAHCGRLVGLKGIGHFTYEPTSPEIPTECIWDLASLTKVVATTTMAMLLYERRLLQLDQTLAEIVPDFDGAPERKHVTCRMLLSHSSGLPGYVKLFENHRTEGAIVGAAAKLPLEAQPGTRTEYSDPGFILLGAALAGVAQEGLDMFCEREIFRPLGMNKTRFCPPETWRERIPPTEDDQAFRHKVIHGVVNDENAWAMGGVAGHAGLFASALDVARFAECMLNGGAPILKSATVDLFTRRESVLFGGCLNGAKTASHTLPGHTSRALGWDTPSRPSQSGKYFSAHSFGHLGFTGTSLWCDPERQLSVTLLTNRTWPDRSSQLIKQVRPQFHDAVIECLGLT